MGFRDRLLGDPDRLDAAGKDRALRYGTATLRIRAALALARAGEVGKLRSLLADPVPGVRRAAARGLGWAGGAVDRDALHGALIAERTDTVRAALAGACIRAGADPDDVLAWVRHRSSREVATFHGPRKPGAVTGSGPTEAERAVWAEIGRAGPGPARLRDEVIAEGLAALEADPHGPGAKDRLPGLAAQAPEGLRERLKALEQGAGRRSEHTFLEALGWLGDPAVMPRLRDALRATDADPARGFAHRKLAAVAIGRLGDPEALRELEAALEREALEFEGRPGAGLGVQFPVRNLLLWAMGEIGAPGAAPTLAGYLENTHGSATGGFHLPAIGALAKLGDAAERAVAPLVKGNEVLAAHARSVLDQLGPLPERPPVGKTEPDPSVEADPDALSGLALLLAGDWFEAHEALELAWRRAEGDRKLALQALIQGAVCLEHLRRGNPRGAWGQWTKCRAKLAQIPPEMLGVRLAQWRLDLDAFAARIGLEGRASSGATGDLPPEPEWPLPELLPELADRLPT
jgi:HEAT repeat protein